MVVNKTKKVSPVNAFINSGHLSGENPADIATACDSHIRALTQTSTVQSIEIAEKFIRQAKAHGGILYLTALRSAGWAYLVAGKYLQAKKAYLSARSKARKQPEVQARIDRVLIDVYMYLGNFKEARRRANLALASFKRLKAHDDIAKTKVNFANVLHRKDHHREAYRLYHQASEHFFKNNNKLATALCWYNEGNTLVQLFDFEQAGRLYQQARDIFQKENQNLHAIGCLYGLAWLHMLEGNFHIALSELSECERFYSEGDHQRETVLCLLDRAESYLGLNLLQDARESALKAGKLARKLGITYETAKADFFAGSAYAGLGQTAAASLRLKKADQSFSRDKNAGFLTAVRFARSRLLPTNAKQRLKIQRIRSHSIKPQLPLWEAICDLELAESRPNDSAPLKRLAKNRAVKIVPHLAAKRHTIIGDRAANRGRSQDAISHWTQAAEILDSVRAKLPPVEMRSSYFAHHSDPIRKLIGAQASNDPMKAAVWSERQKTIGIWSSPGDLGLINPARTRVEKGLSDLAAQVAAVTNLTVNSSGKRSDSSSRHINQVYSELRKKVQHDLSLLLKSDLITVETNEAIGKIINAVSFMQPTVQFHVGQTDLIALIHHNGECRAHTYPGGVKILEKLVARWRFIVECVSGDGLNPRSADIKEEINLLKQFSDWLLSPLELASDIERLLLVPEGQIYSVPWLALTRSGIPLVATTKLTTAPSIRHFLQAKKTHIRSGAARVFVGADKGLNSLNKEVSAVNRRLSGLKTKVCNPSRRSDWPDNGSFRVWHYAGHANLRVDNPFYSSLQLADEPMFAADFRLKRNKVDLVTLAACRTGQHVSLPGEESSGLVRAMLEMGARNVLASSWAVSDLSTSLWMDKFYKSYIQGFGTSEAVQSASMAVREKFPSAYHWSAFSVHGAG